MFTNVLRSFAACRRGQVSVLFALASVPLLIAAGAAVDRIRMDSVRTDMQAALDGASLAAANARTGSNDDRERIARDYFSANFAYDKSRDAKLRVKVTDTDVTMSSSIDVPTSFMRLAGINSTNIDVTAEVMRPKNTAAEVVMVLDYSGSMKNNNKYGRMSAAATRMVDTLSGSMPKEKLKFGLVPFSSMVFASMPANYVSQISGSATWTGCTQDRAYPNNTTVNTPISGDTGTLWGYIEGGNENSGKYDCGAYASNKLGILPLTNDYAAVKAKLAAMRPLGNTNIPLGAEFGWNLLDPAAPYAEGVAYTDTGTRKYLILLTDGVQTSKQWGSGGSRSVQNGNDNLVTLCSQAAAKGITIFTIAYDVDAPAVTDLLKKCAGDRYYEPDVDNTEIARVFASITREIKSQTTRLAR